MGCSCGHWVFNSYSASHDNWCTATLWNRIMTAQCKGMGEVGSARYEPALLPPCPSIRVLSYSNCQEIHSRQQTGLAVQVLSTDFYDVFLFIVGPICWGNNSYVLILRSGERCVFVIWSCIIIIHNVLRQSTMKHCFPYILLIKSLSPLNVISADKSVTEYNHCNIHCTS